MEITWFGRRCFSIRGKDATVLTDPYESVAKRLGRGPAVRAATFSLPDTNAPLPFLDEELGKAITGPGEYEMANIFITGVGTVHPGQGPEGGDAGSKNTVYAIELEEIVLCHMGDLQQALTTEQVERLGDVGLLMVPIGSAAALKASLDTISLMEPRLVIPMDYGPASPDGGEQARNLIRFLKELGATNPEPQKRLHVTASSLPEQIQVAILESVS